MYGVRTETPYLRRRLRESLAMAETASGPCARLAHEMLARLYAEKIEALSALPILHDVDAVTVSVQLSIGPKASHLLVTSRKTLPCSATR